MPKYLVWMKGLATVHVPYIVHADSEEEAIEEQKRGGGVYYDSEMEWSFDENTDIERSAEPYEEDYSAHLPIPASRPLLDGNDRNRGSRHRTRSRGESRQARGRR